MQPTVHKKTIKAVTMIVRNVSTGFNPFYEFVFEAENVVFQFECPAVPAHQDNPQGL
jgi:hypothetical protein